MFKEINSKKMYKEYSIEIPYEDVVNSINFALNQPRNVTIRDLVLLPRNQDL